MLRKKIKEQRNKLVGLLGVEGTPDVVEISKLKKQLHTLMEQEEAQWKQRTKIKWLKHGDKKTRFFHACANQRQNSNIIRMICNAKGNCWEDPDEIGKAFVDYFTTLFTMEQADNLKPCLDHLEVKVTAQMNSVLL